MTATAALILALLACPQLWVAFVRDANIDPKIDLTLEIKGAGTWSWKGVDLESKYEVPAKGPDRK